MNNKKFLGMNLYIARSLNELTLQDLADNIGLTKQAIQYFESGSREPLSETIDKLSEILMVDKKFFYLNDNYTIPSEQFHFRKRKLISKKIEDNFLNRINIIKKIILYIENNINLPENIFLKENLFDIDIKTLNIEDIVDYIKDIWSIKINAPILNISRIIENRGCIILSMDDIIDKIDACSLNFETPIIIRASKSDNICRVRFTLAHEMAHLIIHKGIETGDILTEMQANRFASCFLMPKVAFIEETKEFLNRYTKFNHILLKNLKSFKVRWGVAFAAIFRRAFDLKMIDENQYQEANIFLRKNHYIKNEIFDEEIGINETNTIFNNSISLLESNGRIDDLLNFLCIKQGLFEKITNYKLKKQKENIIRLNF